MSAGQGLAEVCFGLFCMCVPPRKFLWEAEANAACRYETHKSFVPQSCHAREYAEYEYCAEETDLIRK